MPRVKPYEAGLNELRWLTLSQAMTYTHRLTTEQFRKDFCEVSRKKAPKGFLYDKFELDEIIINKFSTDRS